MRCLPKENGHTGRITRAAYFEDVDGLLCLEEFTRLGKTHDLWEDWVMWQILIGSFLAAEVAYLPMLVCGVEEHVADCDVGDGWDPVEGEFKRVGFEI